MTKRDFGLVGNLLTRKPDSRLHSLTHEIAQAESGAQQNESRSIYCLCSAYWLHIWMQSAISARFRSPDAGIARAEYSFVDEFEALIQFIPFHYITFFCVFFLTSTAIKFKWRWKSWNLWPRVLGELLRLERVFPSRSKIYSSGKENFSTSFLQLVHSPSESGQNVLRAFFLHCFDYVIAKDHKILFSFLGSENFHFWANTDGWVCVVGWSELNDVRRRGSLRSETIFPISEPP